MGNSTSREADLERILLKLFENRDDKTRSRMLEKIWKRVSRSGVLSEEMAIPLMRAFFAHCRKKERTRSFTPPLEKQSRKRHLMGFSFDYDNSNTTVTEEVSEDEVPPEVKSLVMSSSEALSAFTQLFLQKIDLDKDGSVTENEFRIWMAYALKNPYKALKEIVKRHDTVQSASSIERPSISGSFNSKGRASLKPNSRYRLKSAVEQQQKQSTRHTRATSCTETRKYMGEDLGMIESDGVYDNCPVKVTTPYGIGRVIEDEKDGVLKVYYTWGADHHHHHHHDHHHSNASKCTGYFKRSTRLEGHEFRRTYRDVHLSFTENYPGEASSSTELTDELRLHREIAMEAVSDDIIKRLSDEQLKSYMHLLLARPSVEFKKRLEENIELLRRAFWVLHSNEGSTSIVHSSYNELLASKAPIIQRSNTVKFFRHTLPSREAKTRLDNQVIFCPLFPSRIVQRVDYMKRFTSGHGPMLLSLEFKGLSSLPVKVIYKPDECRADAACLTMFKIFNRCWEEAFRNTSPPNSPPRWPYAYTFEVCPLEKSSGQP